ncbi:MAG: hypothetical protein U5N56_05035 [Candidatus Marinimicrobia bacterium]|nr:hypothetical protein [Candidatus Neomarinimicrobiota bacterium]
MINIAITYNERTGKNEEEGELYYSGEIDKIVNAISSLGYKTTAVEVSGPPDEMVDRLLAARPDLIFNIAEGRSFQGIAREAYYPVIFELLGLPIPAGNPLYFMPVWTNVLPPNFSNCAGSPFRKALWSHRRNPRSRMRYLRRFS